MGFGKRTDPSTGRTLDLDKTYKNIIQPSVIKAGLECVRADEIQDSGIIDKSMYALLIQSDLVIADISTFNPNAIYELGIRHAVRPFSTIIVKEKEGRVPFDLDHTRTFMYTHLGEDIGADEATRCVKDLTRLITTVVEKKSVDSPLYEYFDCIKAPELPEDEFASIITELADKEKHIFAIVEKAKNSMILKDFASAFKYWDKASRVMENETYFIQQKALSKYKSEAPSRSVALTDALSIIEDLLPSNDPETLGIAGAINKNLYEVHDDIEYLTRAINLYEKGWHINENHYTGENYSICLDLKSKVITDENEKNYIDYESNKVITKIVENLTSFFEEEGNTEPNSDFKWMYASLSNCYYKIGNHKDGDRYEVLFKSIAEEWEIESFEKYKSIK